MNLCRKIFLIVAGIVLCSEIHAQTLEEWTQQDKTRIKRMLEQIAANKVYIEFAQTGVKIVSKGLDMIEQIKDGDLKLHINYFDSLFTANAAIRNSTAVKEIVSNYLRVMRISQQLLRSLPKLKQLTDKEMKYCRQVFDRLLGSCAEDVHQVRQFINSAVGDEFYAMTDDERIRRIHKLLEETREKASFAYSFSSDIKILAMQRVAETITIKHSRLLQ